MSSLNPRDNEGENERCSIFTSSSTSCKTEWDEQRGRWIEKCSSIQKKMRKCLNREPEVIESHEETFERDPQTRFPSRTSPNANHLPFDAPGDFFGHFLEDLFKQSDDDESPSNDEGRRLEQEREWALRQGGGTSSSPEARKFSENSDPDHLSEKLENFGRGLGQFLRDFEGVVRMGERISRSLQREMEDREERPSEAPHRSWRGYFFGPRWGGGDDFSGPRGIPNSRENSKKPAPVEAEYTDV